MQVGSRLSRPPVPGSMSGDSSLLILSRNFLRSALFFEFQLCDRTMGVDADPRAAGQAVQTVSPNARGSTSTRLEGTESLVPGEVIP